MSAENCFAVMAAHDPCSPGSTVQGPPDRADALSADVESAVGFHLALLEVFASAIILDVQGDLFFRTAQDAR
jgi:hypothetical protein